MSCRTCGAATSEVRQQDRSACGRQLMHTCFSSGKPYACRTRTVSHVGSDGSTMAQRIGEAGFTTYPQAENVAGGQNSALQVAADWMCSEGHRNNIMVGLVWGFTASCLGSAAVVLAPACTLRLVCFDPKSLMRPGLRCSVVHDRSSNNADPMFLLAHHLSLHAELLGGHCRHSNVLRCGRPAVLCAGRTVLDQHVHQPWLNLQAVCARHNTCVGWFKH